MSDQAAMQDYVRRRLAGTEPAPVPAQNPAASYVLAQGAIGSRVPPDTMSDSPQFLEAPDTGNETTAPVLSSRELHNQARAAQQNQLIEQMKALSARVQSMDVNDPQFSALLDQSAKLNEQFKATLEDFNQTTGAWTARQLGRIQNRDTDADAIQRAIQERQNQPRQPLPPPAPGGVSPGAPMVPLTRDLTS